MPKPSPPGSVALARSIAARAASGVVRAYQYGVSPWLRPSCRFVPSCSEYAREAFDRHGFWGGLKRATWRLLRCHPLHAGGVDMVD